MVNEFGTDVSIFNINDYIWYIVGGVALFFVVVGFIADKTGLAKKTFSKDAKKINKKAVEPVQDISAQNVVPEFNDMDTQTGSVVEMPVEDNLSYVDNEMNIENDGIIGETEPLYISEEPEVMTDELGTMEPVGDNYNVDLNAVEVEPVEFNTEGIVDEASSEENVWDETVAEDESVTEMVLDSLENDSNIEINNEDFEAPIEEPEVEIMESSIENENIDIGEDVSMNSLENNEVVENDTVIPDIAAENAEDEWGVDSSSDNNEENNLVEVELPNLEDIEINTEEDVWKF